MNLLALDTATERMAVAVAHGPDDLTLDAPGGANASSQLIPQALALLAQTGLTLADVDAVAVGRGPGAFTGLRSAIAVAQGLAFGANKPVLLIDSLLIVAEDARQQALAAGSVPQAPWPLWVAMDARMDEVYAAAYQWQPGSGWTEQQPPGLYDLPTLLACWAAAPPQAVAGSALAAFGPRLGLSPSVAVWPHTQSRAAALAQLARAAWQQGRLLAPDDALPLYLRDKVALTTAERLAARLAKEPPA